MVVFTCNHCGESVHKPKIEKHYQFACRNYKSLTCVDCFKDFRDEEYVSHTKCLTEDERYSSKGAFKNGNIKKGDIKQDSWLDMIRSICNSEENLKPPLRNLLNTISEYSNVPRKKQKFINFIRSSSGNRANMKDVEEAWDIIEKYKYKNIQTNETKAQNLSENINTEKNENQNSIETPQKRPKENDGIEEIPKKMKKSSKVNSQDGLENTLGENTNFEKEEILKEKSQKRPKENDIIERIPKKKKKSSKVDSRDGLEHTLDQNTNSEKEETLIETPQNGLKENDGIKEISKKKKKSSKVNSQDGLENTFDEISNPEKEESLKRKGLNKTADSILEANTNLSEQLNGSTQSSDFNFKEKILEILMEKNSISHKKLQKKILKAYLSTTGESDCKDKVVKKLNKKLKKIPNVGIEDDRVVLQC